MTSSQSEDPPSSMTLADDNLTIEVTYAASHQHWTTYLDKHSEAMRQLIVQTVKNVRPEHKHFIISLYLTDDAELQRLNQQFREKDKPTNVLSFPQYAYFSDVLKEPEPVMIGDIAISYDTVQKEAEANNISFHVHMMHMFVHGTLHLLGFDHQTDAEAKEMEELETALLAAFNIKSPYN